MVYRNTHSARASRGNSQTIYYALYTIYQYFDFTLTIMSVYRSSMKGNIMTWKVTVLSIILVLLMPPSLHAVHDPCPPTAPDAQGPFYKPSVPLKGRTGSGLVISGMVKTAGSCEKISGARVEWWQTNPQGSYDDAHRGALLTGADGKFSLETSFPPGYSGRPPHVHFKVIASGHRTLTTQIYPQEGHSSIDFDFVLVKE